MLAGRLEGGPMADGHQHVMQSPPPRHVVVHLVGRHDDSSTSFGHRRTALEHPLVLRAQVMVQLAEDILLTQRHHLGRSEEHTSELQSHLNLVCRLLLEKKNMTKT